MAKDCTESCGGECFGREEYVKVSGNGWDYLYFIYCQNAINVDKKAGFSVEIIAKEEYEKEMEKYSE